MHEKYDALDKQAEALPDDAEGDEDGPKQKVYEDMYDLNEDIYHLRGEYYGLLGHPTISMRAFRPFERKPSEQ